MVVIGANFPTFLLPILAPNDWAASDIRLKLYLFAISFNLSYFAGNPNKSTAIMAEGISLVGLYFSIFSSRSLQDILNDLEVTSTNTGSAPTSAITSAVAV